MSSDLNPSKLGAKEHWDKVYAEEVANFDEMGEEGEVWFGMETVEKMVDWVSKHVPLSANILEVGSGNGILLFALLEAGYNRLTGVDYSADAVKLAKRVATTRTGREIVDFIVADFLFDDIPPTFNEALSKWDVVLDKGTFDAIALGAKDEHGQSPAARYPKRLRSILRPGGLFLITSCNFTEDELKTWFITPETGLQYHGRIQHPTFAFGGQSGSICSSVAFKQVG